MIQLTRTCASLPISSPHGPIGSPKPRGVDDLIRAPQPRRRSPSPVISTSRWRTVLRDEWGGRLALTCTVTAGPPRPYRLQPIFLRADWRGKQVPRIRSTPRHFSAVCSDSPNGPSVLLFLARWFLHCPKVSIVHGTARLSQTRIPRFSLLIRQSSIVKPSRLPAFSPEAVFGRPRRF